MAWWDERDDKVDRNYTKTNTALANKLRDMGVNVNTGSSSSSRAPSRPTTTYRPPVNENVRDRQPSRRPSRTPSRDPVQGPAPYTPPSFTPYQRPSRTSPSRGTSNRVTPTSYRQAQTTGDRVYRRVPTEPIESGDTFYTPTNRDLAQRLYDAGIDVNNLRQGDYQRVIPTESIDFSQRSSRSSSQRRQQSTVAEQPNNRLRPSLEQASYNLSKAQEEYTFAQQQAVAPAQPPPVVTPPQPNYAPRLRSVTPPQQPFGYPGYQDDKAQEEFLFAQEQERQRRLAQADISGIDLGDPLQIEDPTVDVDTSIQPSEIIGPTRQFNQAPIPETFGPNHPDQASFSYDEMIGQNIMAQWEIVGRRISQDWSDAATVGRMNFFDPLRYSQEREEATVFQREDNERIMEYVASLPAPTVQDPHARALAVQAQIHQAEEELGLTYDGSVEGVRNNLAHAAAQWRGVSENIGQIPITGNVWNFAGNLLMTVAEGIGGVTRTPAALPLPELSDDERANLSILIRNSPPAAYAYYRSTLNDADREFLTVGERIGTLTETILNPGTWLNPMYQQGRNPIVTFAEEDARNKRIVLDAVYGPAPGPNEVYIDNKDTQKLIEARAIATAMLDFSGPQAAQEYMATVVNRDEQLEELARRIQTEQAASQNMNLGPQDRAQHAFNAAQAQMQFEYLRDASPEGLALDYLNPVRDAVLSAATDLTLWIDVATWGRNVGRGIAYSGSAWNPNARRARNALEVANMADEEVSRAVSEVIQAPEQRSAFARAVLEGGASRVSQEQKQARSILGTVLSNVTNREDIPVILKQLSTNFQGVIDDGIDATQLHSDTLLSLAESGRIRIPEAQAVALTHLGREVFENLRGYADDWVNMVSLKDPKATINDVVEEILQATEIVSAERHGVGTLTKTPPIGTASLRYRASTNAAGETIHVVEYVDQGDNVLARSAKGTEKLARREIRSFEAAVKNGDFVAHNPADIVSRNMRRFISTHLIYSRPGSWVRNAVGGLLTGVSTASNTLKPVAEINEFVLRNFANAPYEYLDANAVNTWDVGGNITRGPLKSLIRRAQQIRGGQTELPGGIAFGENAFKAKAWYTGAQDLSRTATESLWNKVIEPAFAQADMPAYAQNFTKQQLRLLAKDWDINRFVEEVTQYASGQRRGLDLGEFGRHYAEALPVFAQRTLSEIAENVDSAPELAMALRHHIDDEILKLQAVEGYAPEVSLPVNIEAELADAVAEVQSAASRIRYAGGDASRALTINEQMQAIQESLNRIYLLAASARNSEAVELISRYYGDLDVARRDVYMALDDLSRQMQGTYGAFRSDYEAARLAYWDEFSQYAVQRGQETLEQLAGTPSAATPRVPAMGSPIAATDDLFDDIAEMTSQQYELVDESLDVPTAPIDVPAVPTSVAETLPSRFDISTPEGFDQAVNQASFDTTEGLGYKSFINRTYETFLRQNPSSTMSLDEFKSALIDARQRGDVVLSRADMAYALDQTNVNESLIIDPTTGNEIHFVTKPDGPPSAAEASVPDLSQMAPEQVRQNVQERMPDLPTPQQGEFETVDVPAPIPQGVSDIRQPESPMPSGSDIVDIEEINFRERYRGNLFGERKAEAIQVSRQVRDMHWDNFFAATDEAGDTRAMGVMLQTQQDISRMTAETKSTLAPLREQLDDALAVPGVREEIQERRGRTRAQQRANPPSENYRNYREAAEEFYTAQANEEYDLLVRTSAKIQAATAYVRTLPEPVSFRHSTLGNVQVAAVRGDTVAVRVNGGEVRTVPISDLDTPTVESARRWQERVSSAPQSVDSVAVPGMNAGLDAEIKPLAREYFDDLSNSRNRYYVANAGMADSVADTILLLDGLRSRSDDIAERVFAKSGETITPAHFNAMLDAANTARKHWGRIRSAATQHGDNVASYQMIDMSRTWRADQLLALMFPYHTFTTRTYKNLLERVATQAAVRHAFSIEGAFFEERNGDPAKQYVEYEVGGVPMRSYASLSGYTMGVFSWDNRTNYYEQQQIDGPLGAAFQLEKTIGAGLYPTFDFADAGIQDPYWDDDKGDRTLGGVAGVLARAFSKSIGDLPWGQTGKTILNLAQSSLWGMENTPSWMITERLVRETQRMLAAKVQDGEITEAQALYAAAVLQASAGGEGLPSQMTPEQIAQAEKLLNKTVQQYGVGRLVTRLTSDIAGLTSIPLTEGRSELPDVQTFDIARPSDIASMELNEYIFIRGELDTLINAGQITGSDAEALGNWLATARTGSKTEEAPAGLARLNARLNSVASRQRRTERRLGIPIYTDPEGDIGLSEAQSLYYGVQFPNNEAGGRAAQSVVREGNPGVTVYWGRYNILENGESLGTVARRTEYFDATEAIYDQQSREVVELILANSGRYTTNAEVKEVREKYRPRLDELKEQYGDVLEGTGFEANVERMNPHERALHELRAVLEYDGENPPVPSNDMTPEEQVSAWAAREQWEEARLDYIERTMEQYMLTENPSEWEENLKDFARGEYASELVRQYLHLKHASTIERQWDHFSSIEREMEDAEFAEREQAVVERLGEDALRKYKIYTAQGPSGSDERRTYADDNPEITEIRKAMFEPDVYDAAVSQFGRDVWKTYIAYKDQKPEFPGRDADAKATQAYYDQLNALNARYPQAAEIQFWVEGRYHYWDAWGDEAIRSQVDSFDKTGADGRDYQLAVELFGEDIFEISANVPYDKGNSAVGRYYDRYPQLSGFNAWKKQYRDMPESIGELQQVNLEQLEELSRQNQPGAVTVEERARLDEMVESGELTEIQRNNIIASIQARGQGRASFMTEYGMYAGPRPVGTDRQPISETAVQRSQRLILESVYQAEQAAEQARQSALEQAAQGVVTDPSYQDGSYQRRGGSGGGGYYSPRSGSGRRRYYGRRGYGRRYYGGRRHYGGGGGGGSGFYQAGPGVRSPNIGSGNVRVDPVRVGSDLDSFLWQSLLSRYRRPGA